MRVLLHYSLHFNKSRNIIPKETKETKEKKEKGYPLIFRPHKLKHKNKVVTTRLVIFKVKIKDFE